MGNPGFETILAIEFLQRVLLKFRIPDGLIEPSNRTILDLLESLPVPTGSELMNEEVVVIEINIRQSVALDR